MKTPDPRCLAIAFLLGSVAVPGSPEEKASRSEPRLLEPDLMSGSIGVTVLLGGGIGKASANEVFFVKLEDGNEAFSATDLIPSNYRSSRQVFLLNADPGRYVAVAARFRSHKLTLDIEEMGGEDRAVFFSMEMISETEVTVVAQDMVFMGEFRVNRSRRTKNADAAQAHYLRLQLPWPSSAGGYFSRGKYTGKMKRVAQDSETERGFWTKACDKAFRNDSRWRALAAQQLVARRAEGPQ